MKRYRTYPTRNHSASQSPMRPKGFLWHTTEGHGMEYLLSLLSGEVGRGDGVRPSTHFLISRKGDCYELAPWRPGKALVCWHAGRSEWKGISGLNRHLLGVELEHLSGEAYPPAQIAAAVELARTVRAAYGPAYHWEWGLLEHRQVAYPRGRKSDPTAPWASIRPRILAAWEGRGEEDDMAVATVKDKDAAAAAHKRLAEAGILTASRPVDDAASVGLMEIALVRLLDRVTELEAKVVGA